MMANRTAKVQKILLTKKKDSLFYREKIKPKNCHNAFDMMAELKLQH